MTKMPLGPFKGILSSKHPPNDLLLLLRPITKDINVCLRFQVV